MKIESFYKDTLNRFDLLAKREYANSTLRGFQLAVIGILQFFIALSVFELLWNFSSGVRTIIFFVFLVYSIGLLGYLFFQPLLGYLNIIRRIDYSVMAKKVGTYFPFIKDDLVNALQIVTVQDSSRLYSSALREAAFEQIYSKTKEVNFSDAVKFDQSKKLFKYLVLTVLISALFLVFIPGLSTASYRLINFNKDFIPPAKFLIDVIPGNAEVTKGDNINIRAKITGPKPEDVFFAIKYSEQAEYELKNMEPDSSGNFNFEIPAVRNSFNYYVKVEDVVSSNYKISVVDKPIIRTLDVTVIPPSYSKQPTINLHDNGNVTALVGSKIIYELSATKQSLKKVFLSFNDSTEVPFSVTGRNAQGTYSVRKDQDYKIILQDNEGNHNENPVDYSIKALTDAVPEIEIILPDKNIVLGDDDRLGLLLKIRDDFGFSKLLLHYRLSSSKYEKPQDKFSSIEIPINNNGGEPASLLKEEDINYIWNLSPMNLATEDEVTYYIEIFDNDVVSGPKSASTAMFTVRVPTLDELFSEADKTHENAEKQLSETLDEAKKLKEDLDKISQDLKSDKKDITWEEKEKIEKTFDKVQELQSKTDEIKKNMADLQKDLQQNNLLSKETLEKYMELQDLFEQLGTEEMKKAMEKMQQMLQNLNRDQVEKAMQEMQFNEEQMKKSIERTLNLLKRVQIEQKMDELEKRTKDLAENLEKLQEQTKNNSLQNESDKQEMSNKQNEATENLKELEQQMKDLQEKMKEFKDMPNEKMDETVNEFQKQQNQQMSSEAQQQLMKGQKQQAMQNQQQLSQNMQQLQQQMDQLQQQMQSQNQRQVFNDMMKIMDNLLTLSKEQEKLKEQTKSMQYNSPQFNENAKKQNELQSDMDKILSQLNALSQKTFAISPEMGRALGKANQSMRQSTNGLQNRNGAAASKSQGDAMSSLNEAASLMKGSMEGMMSGGGSGSGMMSMMQQLQQLSQQQMNLNNLTQQMQQGNMSMQQQAEVQRLAQQQELIRKSLDQLNKEAKMSGDSKKIPANLDRVLQDMQEVVTDMKTEKLDNELVQKQERILSRMLDAQRSINERDFEKERESNTGENVARNSPADINLSARQRNKIKDELNKAVQEGYSRDYENLIRKYFEALGKEQKTE